MKAAQLHMVTDPRKDGTEARMYDPNQQEDGDRDGTTLSLNRGETDL